MKKDAIYPIGKLRKFRELRKDLVFEKYDKKHELKLYLPDGFGIQNFDTKYLFTIMNTIQPGFYSNMLMNAIEERQCNPQYSE